MTNEIDETVKKSEEVVAVWKVSYEELEKEMQQQAAAAAEQAKELVGGFRDQLDAATDAISLWEAHCSELNEQLEEWTDSYYEDQIISQL